MSTATEVQPIDLRAGFPRERFVLIRDVPVFVEHEAVIRGQRVRFGRAELEALAERCNRRIEETGDYVPLTLGHTPAPGENKPDPEVVGFAGPFRLGEYEGKPAILADFHIYREDLERVRKYPRRSPELWWEDSVSESYLDPIALLGAETPKLDMGLLQYRRIGKRKHVKRYMAVAPGPANVFVPEEVEAKKEYAMALTPEDVQQVLAALEGLDWVQWVKAQMAAQTEAQQESGDSETAPPPPEQDSKNQYEQPSADIDPEKAKQILRDGEVRGHPLTEAQRGMFGAAAGRARDSRNSDQQPERYRALEVEVQRLRHELEREQNRRRNSERYARLSELRQEYAFDLEREVERCRAEKMDDQRFAEHVEIIRENYQRIPIGEQLPVGVHAGPALATKAHYEKELHDRARKIAERRAMRGQPVDYAEVVEQLRNGKAID